MKEASGEFSMTLVVIVGAVAIIGILTTVLLPLAQNYVESKWSEIGGAATVKKTS